MGELKCEFGEWKGAEIVPAFGQMKAHGVGGTAFSALWAELSEKQGAHGGVWAMRPVLQACLLVWPAAVDVSLSSLTAASPMINVRNEKCCETKRK